MAVTVSGRRRSTIPRRRHHHYLDHYYGWLLVSLVCVGGVSAQEGCGGPSTPVVVVASVLGTLAVVAIVLGAVFFICRRRNAGFLFPPKRARKSNGLSDEDGNAGNQTDNSCYDNPAFSRDPNAAEEGRIKLSPKKNASPSKKQTPTKAENQKSWTSLPARGDDDHDGLHRQGSCGSLGNNYVGPETTSVWLQSQDIIGLGFNISGNMRDGIYVSQVHNRGPAIESGEIKVGDRIVSVTIAYDNIVYEDALTILSYASPYPVKVTLQKERAMSSESRSGSTERLNHPLYRSQSLDALQRIAKAPPFRAQRTQSEMKSDTRRDSPRRNNNNRDSTASGGGVGVEVEVDEGIERKSQATSESFSPSGGFAAVKSAVGGFDLNTVKSAAGKIDFDSDVVVHAAETVDGKISFKGVKPAHEGLKFVKGQVGKGESSAPSPPSSPQEASLPSSASARGSVGVDVEVDEGPRKSQATSESFSPSGGFAAVKSAVGGFDLSTVKAAAGKIDFDSDMVVNAAETVDGKISFKGVKPAHEGLKFVKGQVGKGAPSPPSSPQEASLPSSASARGSVGVDVEVDEGIERKSQATSESFSPSGGFAAVKSAVGGFDLSTVKAAAGKIDFDSDMVVNAAETIDGKISFKGVKPAHEGLKFVKGQVGKGAPSPPSSPQEASLPSSVSATVESEGSGGEGESSAANRKKSKIDTEEARKFASLMDQMLDDGPDSKKPSDNDNEDDMELSSAAGNLNSSPRSKPSKPERKKKPSNSSIVSLDDDPTQFFGGGFGVEDAIVAVKSIKAHAAPPGGKAEEDLGPEVEEEMIQPAFVKRDVVVASKDFEFTPRERGDDPAPRSRSPTAFAQFSMSDSVKRSSSPDGDPVEEETLQASVAAKDNAAPPLPSSARSRGGGVGRGDDDSSKEKKKKREKSKEKKTPVIPDEELEKMIAMNSFPPGSQGWAGIKAGGSDGGVRDDFMPPEISQQAFGLASKGLQQLHQRSSSSSSEASSSHSSGLATRGRGSGSRGGQQQRGGVAFEVRDDVVTGRPVSVEIGRNSNNSSPSRSGSHDRDKLARATSPRDDLLAKQQQQQSQGKREKKKEDKENREDGLDWSGKRLVRSGSFSEIPLAGDTSITDWTDKNLLNDNDDDDDDVSTTSGKRSTADTNPESDSEVDAPRVLPGRDIFKARENLANMSDLSNSISSSRSSSPAVTANGPADGLGLGVGLGGGGLSVGVKNSSSSSSMSTPSTISLSGPTLTSDTNANSKQMGRVTLHTNSEEDMEC